MSGDAKIKLPSLVTGFSQIPHDGLKMTTSEPFSALYNEDEQDQRKADRLEEVFCHPVDIDLDLTPVGSKLDVRGSLQTQVQGVCDRCTGPAEAEIKEAFEVFLMPEEQFSEYDKPQGKVIHGREGEKPKSRHHSKSKAEVLTDAEGEHEDVAFGAFDGERVDLRHLVREALILALPMRWLCKESCEGLCIRCRHNLNEGPCQCAEGPAKVELEAEQPEKPQSELAAKLAAKLQGN